MAPWICETVVDGEDFWVAGRTEPGLSTGLVETVVFGRNEPAPQHLHKAFLRDDRRGRARGLTPLLEVLLHVCVQDDLGIDGEALMHVCSGCLRIELEVLLHVCVHDDLENDRRGAADADAGGQSPGSGAVVKATG